MPFLGLLFTKGESFFEFYPWSHKATQEDGSKLKDKWRIEFNHGDIIIFHPLIIHNGAIQNLENTRIHFYFDRLELPRKSAKGYIYNFPLNDFILNATNFLTLRIAIDVHF